MTVLMAAKQFALEWQIQSNFECLATAMATRYAALSMCCTRVALGKPLFFYVGIFNCLVELSYLHDCLIFFFTIVQCTWRGCKFNIN